MSYLIDALNERLTADFGAGYAMPLTLATYVRCAGFPAVGRVLTLSGSTTDAYPGVGIFPNAASTTDRWRAYLRNAGGTADQAQYSNDNVTNPYFDTWIPVVAVFTSTTSYAIYFDTVAQTATDAGPLDPGNTMRYLSVAAAYDGAADLYAAGFACYLAEIAIWESAPSAGDIEDYMTGTSADQIDAANLLAYWSLATDASQTAGTLSLGALTVTSATWNAEHPVIDYTPPVVGGSLVMPTYYEAFRQNPLLRM